MKEIIDPNPISLPGDKNWLLFIIVQNLGIVK